MLAGAVSITAGCADVEPWAAFVIGIFGSFVYSLACVLMVKLKIDDPIEAVQVHGFCGLYGVIVLGLFHTKNGVFYFDTATIDPKSPHQTRWSLFGIQCLGAVCIFAWATIISSLYFLVVRAMGFLRLSEQDELLGGDIHYFAPIKF